MIPNAILKFDCVIQVLYDLFNICFDYGIIPDKWSESIISPIIKSNNSDHRKPGNYRGISLLSSIAKVYGGISLLSFIAKVYGGISLLSSIAKVYGGISLLSSIAKVYGGISLLSSIAKVYGGISLLSSIAKVYGSVLNNRLMKYLDKNKFLCEEQNGFRQNRSGLDHIFTLHSIIQNKLNAGTDLFIAFIDLKKAFDSINRDLLFLKLKGPIPSLKKLRQQLCNLHLYKLYIINNVFKDCFAPH